MARHDHSTVAVITDAKRSTTLDLEARTKRYLITMGFRTACFVGMIFAPGGWKLVLLAGAAILPGIAVLFANAEDRHKSPVAEDGHDPWTAPALPSRNTIEGEIAETDDES